MPLDEGTLLVDDLVDTKVRVEVGLDVLEHHDRAISSSATVESMRQLRLDKFQKYIPS